MLNGELVGGGVLTGEIGRDVIVISKEEQDVVVKPRAEQFDVYPDAGKVIKKVTVEAVTPDIDIDIQPEDIREGVDILGVVGTLEAREDLDSELAEQESLLAELESGVGELPERPVDRLQWKCDNMKALNYEFYYYEGSSIDILKGLDVSAVTSMYCMFDSCANLITVDLSDFNTSSLTNMGRMFFGCKTMTRIDLSNFDTSKVITFSQLFHDCNRLIDINVANLNTSSVTNTSATFRDCGDVIVLDLTGWDTSNVTNPNYMFHSCYELENILGELNFIKATSLTQIFNSCSKLTNVTLKNIKLNLAIGSGTSWGHLLTDESIINTFQELWDNTDNALGGTRTLTLSTPSKARAEAIYVKLVEVTDEMRAEDEYIDNKKPCVVCESTDEGAMTLKEYGLGKNWNIA